METLEILEKCKSEFCGTPEAQMMFQYRSRAERLSFEERQAVIRKVEECFGEAFPYLKSGAVSLSESDLLYLALASVGIGNPVIAECLCISKDSVRMKKLRLRDKLPTNWYSAIFPEQKRNADSCDESVTANVLKGGNDSITLSQKEYKHLMRKSMKTKMSFKDAVKTCYRKTFTTTGRARRSEFWYFFLFTYIAGIFIGLLNVPLVAANIALFDNPTIWNAMPIVCFDFLAMLAIYIPLLTAGVRRLHDTEHKGAWIWLSIAPTLMMAAVPVTIGILDSRGTAFNQDSLGMVISMVSFFLFYLIWLACSIILVIMLAKEGTEGPNSYGQDPINL